MFEKTVNFINNHFNFKFYGVTWLAFAVGMSIVPCLMYMPQKYGYENCLLENIQMIALFIILILCLTSKVNKKLFRFLALALTLIMIREVNCGRTLFFPIPNTYHQYYSWRDLEWKWLGKVVHLLYGLYIAFVAFIFCKKKIYVDLWTTLKRIKIPFWHMILLFFSMFMGAIAEKATNNNFIFEEGFELLFYVTILGIVWLYSRNKDFIIEETSMNTDRN